MFKVEHRTLQNNGLNMFKIISGHFLTLLLLILNMYLSTGSIIILTGFLLFTLHRLRCNDVEDVMMRRCNEYISNKDTTVSILIVVPALEILSPVFSVFVCWDPLLQKQIMS